MARFILLLFVLVQNGFVVPECVWIASLILLAFSAVVNIAKLYAY